MSIFSANPRLIFLIAFISVLGFLLYRDRDQVQRQSILFYRRTKRGVKMIDKIAKAAPRFWNFYGWTGVLFGVLTIPTILYMVLVTFSDLLSSPGTSAGFSLVMPGITGQTTFQSGISFVPVEYWIISIGILMFVHEMSHGIIARAEGMEINSVGWIVFGIIPGAFVEPKGENMLPGDEDEEDQEEPEEGHDHDGGMWDQGSLKSQLKVLAAGSFANYITAVVFAILALILFMQVSHPSGVFYLAQDGFPAKQAGMDNGTIYSINGERVRYSDEVMDISGDFSVNQTITMNTSEGVFNVTTTERNGSAYIGILMGTDRGIRSSFYAMVNNRRVIKPDYEAYRGVLSWAVSGLQIVALLNLLIGMFNMLPIKPLDGGQMVAALVDEYLPSADKYVNYWSLLVWAALLTAMVYGIVM